MQQKQLTGSSTASTTGTSRERETKRQKENFLMFTRVLIKYLEQKDKRMHDQAKTIIKDCAERNKRQEPRYESVTEYMKRRLKELVGDHYWKTANDYLIHFIEQKRKHYAAVRKREIKRQERKFLMFTRFLIAYLEQKNKRMHVQAKTIIKDCVERNKRQEPGYESVTECMKRRLKELVGDRYWKNVNYRMIRFIEQKRRQLQQQQIERHRKKETDCLILYIEHNRREHAGVA